MLRALRGEVIEAASVGEGEKADFAGFERRTSPLLTARSLSSHAARREGPFLLRAFLESLGDSIVVVDDEDYQGPRPHERPRRGAHRSAHLRPADYGENREYARAALGDRRGGGERRRGREERRRVRPVPPKELGVVAVCAGEGMASVFRDLGADHIISGGQTMNPRRRTSSRRST